MGGPAQEETIVDLTRAEALMRAEELACQGWTVYFKYTCQHCDSRVVLQEANTLYEAGECYICGGITPLDYVGFLLVKGPS